MKKLYSLLVLLVFTGSQIFAQSHEWQWARTEVQPSHPNTTAWTFSVATDQVGNVFMAGYFYTDSISFGPFTLYNSDTSERTPDIFLVKYNTLGNISWARKAGGKLYDYCSSVKTDKAGNIFISGLFYSDSLYFGNYVLHNVGPTDTTCDLFVAKYDPNGNFQWAKSYGGDYYDGSDGLATDATGNVYVSGFYQSDSITLDSYTLYDASGAHLHNGVLIKLDNAGNLKWVANSVCTNGGVEEYGVATDPAGSVIVAGRFSGTVAAFGAQQVQNQLSGNNDIMVVKYDSLGNALWAHEAGGSSDDLAYSIATDGLGNIYTTGRYYSPTAEFDGQQLINDTTDYSADIFVAKYDPFGNIQWVQSSGGKQNDIARSVATDTSGNVYITGYFYSPILVAGQDTVFNYNDIGDIDDIFIEEYNSLGTLVAMQDIGGDYYDAAFGIAVDMPENVYIGGFFRSDNIYFGTNRLDNSTIYHTDNSFLAKYSCVDPLEPIVSVSGDTLTCSAAANNQWYINGTAIPNANGQTFIATQPGSYTVQVVNGPLCIATSSAVVTGLSNLNIYTTINLYPDPAIDMITAQSELFRSDIVNAIVYDMLGNVVSVDQRYSADKIIINASQLVEGVYTIRFTLGDKEIRAKFVKGQ